jgi:predicted RNA binding protein YcfA (HicA-like mRNA interferase family)
MKAGELISRLIQAGWVEVRQKGSHKTFKHPTNPQLVTVPIHGSKDLTRGIIRSIERTAGLLLR